jgi:excinuclease ABC subunit C
VGALAEKVLNLPALPGVYLFKDPAGRVLYVGKARSLAQRVRSYVSGDFAEPRLVELMEKAVDLDTILTDTEAEALLLEATLIRQHRPHYNVLLKDDKSYPYVKISVQEEFPRLSVTRRVLHDGARYLGPFTDVRNLRRMLREIRRIFPVRTCRNFEDYRRTNRPCLYFHIKRCAGPCTTRSRLAPGEYRGIVDGLIQFLTGRDADLIGRLQAGMAEAATERRYEEAARKRDQIALLRDMRRPQSMVHAPAAAADVDVLGLARHGRRAGVAVLMLRDGRVVGKETRLIDHGGSLADAALLEVFLTQHYLGVAPVPRRIAAIAEPESADALREALEKRAGHRVELVVPQRGRERRLIATAERNAALALEDLEARASGRRARFSPEVVELQKALALAVPPWRMVCFDISNLGADSAVAAVVASENGRARRGLYRRMRMRRPGPDDFAMMGEAVERYWTHVESGEIPRPDLVVVDGGVGQLGGGPFGGRRAPRSTGWRRVRSRWSRWPSARRPSSAKADRRSCCRGAARHCDPCSGCATRRTASDSPITASCAGAAESPASSTPWPGWALRAARHCSRRSDRWRRCARRAPRRSPRAPTCRRRWRRGSRAG